MKPLGFQCIQIIQNEAICGATVKRTHPVLVHTRVNPSGELTITMKSSDPSPFAELSTLFSSALA
jgi:hypothetical protein